MTTDVPRKDTMPETAPAPAAAAFVPDPWSVVLRIDHPTLGAYRHLAENLEYAAATANDAAALAAADGSHAVAAELRAVRDTLRKASVDALIGRVSNNPTPCRRCGAACTNCTPPVPS